jgi:hypothetical protein
MGWAGYVACMGRREVSTGVWWGAPKGKRPLGRPTYRFEDNSKMVIQELGLGGVDWIDLAQDGDMFLGLANAIINFRVSYNAENLMTSLGAVSFSSRTLCI